MCLQIPEDRSKISLLESNTQLKPHKAQNYRKKALWVSWFSIIITLALVVAAFKRWKLEAEEDCGGVRQGDHQLTRKYVKNSSRYGHDSYKATSRRQQKTPGLQGGQVKLSEMRTWAQATPTSCCCCCRFSHVWLCVTPQPAARQAAPSLGFSRQEHWSGLPCPSPPQQEINTNHSTNCSLQGQKSKGRRNITLKPG